MTVKVTEYEGKMIDNIGGNNFGDGPGSTIWSNCLDEGPHGAFVTETSFGGIVSSLVKKGLVGVNGMGGRDATLWLTAEGVAIYYERNGGER